ncbi:MAG: DUF4270 domain-containing protein, partial [Fimbriimonadaceae bacterium]|nr:DUF4270 domain-containing protein [Chitinophagales bacterium]
MNKFWIVCGVVLLLFSFVSCRKATFIGDDLIPGSDFLYSARADTFKIITNTLLDDSVATSFNIYHSLGSLNSTVFGKTSADIYTQILMPTSNLTFGANAVADSVVLTLDYAGLYGDSTAQHSLNVYKLVEDIDGSRLYYSNSKLHDLPILIGRKELFTPNLKDSVQEVDDKFPPHLRIRLSDWFAADLLSIVNDSSRFRDNSTFTDYLKGILIETDVSSGYSNSTMYFDLANFISGMTIYYKNDSFDSLSIVFPFSGTKYNYFAHDYAGSTAESYLLSPDTTNGDEEVFVQGFGGLKTYIQFPTLNNLQNVSINKAELTFTIPAAIGELDTVFEVPPSLLLVKADSLLKNDFDVISYSSELFYSLPDQSVNDPLFYGGKL